MKKPSELMLEGFAMAGERQCFNTLYTGFPSQPTAVCAIGAILLAETGIAHYGDSPRPQSDLACGAFFDITGSYISEANNEGMSIPDIAGILRAEGM